MSVIISSFHLLMITKIKLILKFIAHLSQYYFLPYLISFYTISPFDQNSSLTNVKTNRRVRWMESQNENFYLTKSIILYVLMSSNLDVYAYINLTF